MLAYATKTTRHTIQISVTFLFIFSCNFNWVCSRLHGLTRAGTTDLLWPNVTISLTMKFQDEQHKAVFIEVFSSKLTISQHKFNVALTPYSIITPLDAFEISCI